MTFASTLKLWRCAKVGARVRVLGSVWIVGEGRVELGDDVCLDGRAAPIELQTGRGALLRIGEGCVLEAGVSIEAQDRVELGPRCLLRPFAKVMDNQFHLVASDHRRQRPPSSAVRLEAGVELGAHSIVLPGAWLEAGVKLGPGVVIGRHVRSGLTLAGVPPRAVHP
jgi:acetyltransferase-like isoleucine patch superfamily enzyme